VTYDRVLRFWFEETSPAAWWSKDDAFDREITRRFSDTHDRARRCELHEWRRAPLGCVAEVIVLDQFSRNIYRGRPEAFANDSLALALAQEAIAREVDSSLSSDQRAFLYMPFMHSESLAIHDWALELFSAPGLETTLGFEIKHRAIIERFGRYPHRNAILGRTSTAEEVEFLAQPGSSF
jgi:uncharacterized protein (DUF924 family)